MSLNREGRSALVSRLRMTMLVIPALCGLTLLSGCGGSSGGSSSLTAVGVIAEGLGLLPQSNVFLNNVIIAEFNTTIDPDSVSPQTFRVLVGPDFVEQAPGEIGVAGNRITFVPELPSNADLSDSGFQPNTTYRIILRGRPDLNTIRSRGGKPLGATSTFTLTTRQFEPFFTDLVAGDPRVIGVMVDLDGNGVLDGDGDPDTPDDEEFFEGDVDFDSPAFVTGVPVGSVNLEAPNAPLKVGFIFNEPLNPSTVFLDEDDLNGDGIPDGDGNFDSFDSEDTTNTFICDDPRPGDECPRPTGFGLELSQTFAPERNAFFVLVTLEFEYALRGFSRQLMRANTSVEDFVQNRMRESFSATFETGEDTGLDDFFFQDFSTTEGRDPMTTALWNPRDRLFLKGGIGFGGDGSDGDPIEENSGSLTLDTTQNGGVFNFSQFVPPDVATFTVNIVGTTPAEIRVQGDLAIRQGVIISVNGAEGLPGAADSVAPRPGGVAGPGGGVGGSASTNGIATVKGEDGGQPPGTMGGGIGGLSGSGPGGGGGAGHEARGTDGRDGEDVGGGGAAGEDYHDPTFQIVYGGSGGGGGGNNTDGDVGSPGSSGGSGGGGGGALTIETTGNVSIFPGARVEAKGGRGGQGARPQSGFNAAGGGGGSGGTILIRTRRFLSLTGFLDTSGGSLGAGSFPAGSGGLGSDGFVRLETLNQSAPCSPPRCVPTADDTTISTDLLGHSVGRSEFLFTNAAPDRVVEYFFDGSDPTDPVNPGIVVPTGNDIVALDEDGTPVESVDALPSNSKIQIFFRGAFEDPTRPNQPDPPTITEWTADLTDLTGFPLIQWEVRFDIGQDIPEDPAEDPPAPGVDDLRLNFRAR